MAVSLSDDAVPVIIYLPGQGRRFIFSHTYLGTPECVFLDENDDEISIPFDSTLTPLLAEYADLALQAELDHADVELSENFERDYENGVREIRALDLRSLEGECRLVTYRFILRQAFP